MAKKSKPNIKYNLIDILLFLTPFLYGLFPIWSLCLLGIVCVIGIIYKFSKEKRLLVPKGPKVYLLIIYLISFLFTEFVAVDKGMNLLAFIKNIPILLFIILLAQYDNNEEEKNRHLYMVSISSTISVLFSLFLMLIPNSGVYLDNRLHGIFYYANSYGLFLLVGAIILFLKKERKWYDYLMLAVLFVGIILTNSRAIIIMTLVFSIASLFLPVMISISLMPESTASLTRYSIEGLSTIGSISLGTVLEMGSILVPSPAAGITALVIFFIFVLLLSC